MGYGGTKTEMERLLDDAEKIKAKYGETAEYSVDNLADIVEAIHVVQKEQEISGYTLDEIKQKIKDKSLTEQEVARIAQDLYKDDEDGIRKVMKALEEGTLTANDALILTGTTSREANSTIEGSLRSMGAAWENWLITIANTDPEQFEKATDDLIDRVAIAMSNIVPRVGVILANLATFIGERAPTLFEELKTAFFEALPDDEARNKFGEYFEMVSGAIDSVGGALDMMQGAASVISEIIGYVIGNWDDIANTLSGIGEGLTTVGNFFNWLSENGGMIVSTIGTVTAGFVAFKAALGIVGLITALASAFGPAAQMALTLNGGIVTLGGGLGILAGGPIPLVIGIIAALVAAFITAYNTSEDFRNKVDSVVNAVCGFFGNLWTAAKTTFSNLVQGFIDLPNTISNALSNAGTWLYNTGVNIVQGLINGISDNISSVTNTLWNGVIGAYNTVCNWLGIASPSKRFRQVGNYIMEGWANGIEEEADLPESSMLEAAKSVYGAAEGGIEPLSLNGGAMQSTANAILGGISIQIGELVVREEADIDRIAEQLYLKIRREQEAHGWSTSFTMALT